MIHPELATEAWGELDPLTDRERQVLRLAGEGKASGDIAGELGLSDGTVRNYLSEAISKLGASNRVEAARLARTKAGCRSSGIALPGSTRSRLAESHSPQQNRELEAV